MSGDRQIGPWPLEGVDAETWLIRFDEGGACTSPRIRAALVERIRRSPDAPVILLAHGWNNDFPAAVSLYQRFLRVFEAVRAQSGPAPSPLVVGIMWPSLWFPSDDGPRIAADAGPLRDDALLTGVLAGLRNELPAGTDLARLYELLDADVLSLDETRELAALIKPVLRASSDGAEEAGASENAILRTLRGLQDRFDGAGDVDWDNFGTVDRIDPSGGAGASQPAAAGVLDYLDPRWALRLASLYIMKDRAGAVGTKGVAPLLRDILQTSHGPVYAVGHSFGAKVVLSAAAAPGVTSRKLAGMLLLQPAVSHLCFAEMVPGREGPGGYRIVLDRIQGPIATTFSAHDFPLHEIYHHALLRRADLGEPLVASAGIPPSAYAALGGYGPRGAGEQLIDPIPGPGTPIAVQDGVRVIGLDGSSGGLISGHGDVANERTAWALAELLRTTGGA